MATNTTFEQVQEFKHRFEDEFFTSISGLSRQAFQAYIPRLILVVGEVDVVKLDIYTTENKSWAQCTIEYTVDGGSPIVETFSTVMMGSSALLKTLSDPVFKGIPSNFITC